MHSETETYTKSSSYQLLPEAERVFMHQIPRLLVETQEEIVDDIADSFFAVIVELDCAIL